MLVLKIFGIRNELPVIISTPTRLSFLRTIPMPWRIHRRFRIIRSRHMSSSFSSLGLDLNFYKNMMLLGNTYILHSLKSLFFIPKFFSLGIFSIALKLKNNKETLIIRISLLFLFKTRKCRPPLPFNIILCE